LAYTKRLSEVAASKPLLLVAYAQTLYVALLAGGQTMAAFMRTARGLSKGEGDAIFDFPAIPAAEHRRFRAALREAVDALGETLTGVHLSCLRTAR
jgi:heme oxygenase